MRRGHRRPITRILHIISRLYPLSAILYLYAYLRGMQHFENLHLQLLIYIYIT